MPEFLPRRWYWLVGDHPAGVYSSADGGYVALSQPTYLAWLAAGNQPTHLDLEVNLWQVLYQQYPQGLPAAQLQQFRRQGVINALQADDDLNAKRDRALALTILDELNNHALKINAILDAIDGATNLATLKSAVAAIADYPPRTQQQLITALQNHVNAGDVD